jgi:glutaconyl-CoA/methylmalonyl-CoA decarboxylase subunit gamma
MRPCPTNAELETPACSICTRVRYYVSLDPDPGAKPVAVDLVELPSGKLEAQIDSRPVDLDVALVGSRLSVRVAGRVVDLTTEGTPPELGAVASGHRSYVRVESERMRSAEQAKKTTATSSELVLRAPMPGRVVKVLVAKGEAVKAGQGVVVLEAMKMENEVRARATGTVIDIYVTAGAAVESNAKLLALA